MSEETSPLPEFFRLVRIVSEVEGKDDPVTHRRATVSLIDFVREYDGTLLAKLDQ